MKVKILSFVCVLALCACKKNKTTPPTTPAQPVAEIQVHPVFGSETLYLDSTYELADGSELHFKEIKFFFTQLSNGSTPLTDAALFDLRSTGNSFVHANADASQFSALNALIGVDSIRNHGNPAAFPDDSPLNIVNSGDMHWNWNVGYIFVKIEAKADTIPDGISNFDHNITWHSGQDINRTPIAFPVLTWSNVSGSIFRSYLKLDLRRLIDHPTTPLNIRTEATTHSGLGDLPIAQKVMQNFSTSISAE